VLPVATGSVRMASVLLAGLMPWAKALHADRAYASRLAALPGALQYVSPSTAWSLANVLAAGVGSLYERLVSFIDQ